MYSYRRTGSKRRRRTPGEGPVAASPKQSREQVRQALGGAVQAKLTLGAPNDAYEQEADRVADRVVNMPHGTVPSQSTGPVVQRGCADCREEQAEPVTPKLQRQPLEEEEEAAQAKLETGRLQRQVDEEEEEEALQTQREPGHLQRQAAEDEEEEELQTRVKPGSGESGVGGATAESISGMRGKGAPLGMSERQFFEPRFGVDFGAVRIHTGADAAHNAEAIQAKAFTLGRDLFFNSGEYRPETEGGRRLMAHELTHVVQQNPDIARKPMAGSEDGFTIRPYRKSSAVNFGANDSSTMKESSYNRKTPDPYIEKITISFTGTVVVGSGSDKETLPKGTLSASYAANKAPSIPANISGISIVGGYPSAGLTDKGTNMKVHRVEGWGYHHLNPSKSQRVGNKWPENKYFKPSLARANASMSYALFFHGKQAVHLGSLSYGSLSCVHVAAESTMRQLNYHSRENVTKVDVSYTAAALKQPCCERYLAKGYMVSNPCGGQDKKKCKKP